jgi:hypothetical protein
MLAFMKSNGRRSPDGKGWEAVIAAEAVMRKWKGCSGKRYKVRVEAAKASGLLGLGAPPIRSLTKSGRPQEYKLTVPFVKRTDRTLDYAQALALLLNPIVGEPTPRRKRSRRPLRLKVPAANATAAEQGVMVADDAPDEPITASASAERLRIGTTRTETSQPAEQQTTMNNNPTVVEEMPPIRDSQRSTSSQTELPVSVVTQPQQPFFTTPVDEQMLRYAEENRAIERELKDRPGTPAVIRDMLMADRMTMPIEHVQLIMWAVSNERRRRRGEQPQQVPKHLEDLLGSGR